MGNALLQAAVLNNIIIIQNILEKRHTDCDSKIETSERNKIINVPVDYDSIVKTARKMPELYKVKYLDHTYLNSVSSVRPGSKAGDNIVTDITALKYTSDGDIFYKFQIVEDWQLLPKRIGKAPKTFQTLFIQKAEKLKRISIMTYRN